MTKLKEGHVIEYRTVLGDRVVSVVSGPYTSATGHECVELRNGLPIRSDMCKIIGFECPHCGRKYEGTKFTARIHDPDKGPTHLGTFPTEDEAHAAWRKKKKELLLRKEQEIRGIDERIFENLKNWLESESEF